MGKKKNVDMSVDPAEKQAPAKSETKKKMVIWEDLYTDLAPRVASALREARVKPEQLVGMSDGEITAIDGIGEVGLEEIRTKYAPEAAVAEFIVKAEANQDSQAAAEPALRGPRHPDRGGKKIKAMKSKVDNTKLYQIEDAVKLVKETNYTSFDATLALHLNLKERISRVEVTFPHLAGPAKKVAIADEALLKKIEKGSLDFDILLSTPAMMPKLAKYARVLGPKGLMPSPKAGTVTSDPDKKAKEFEGGKTMLKGEAKFPLLHVVIGKLSQPEAELAANIEAVLGALKPGQITKAVLASTMSPGVKLQLSQ